jgi:hypothetical protein
VRGKYANHLHHIGNTARFRLNLCINTIAVQFKRLDFDIINGALTVYNLLTKESVLGRLCIEIHQVSLVKFNLISRDELIFNVLKWSAVDRIDCNLSSSIFRRISLSQFNTPLLQRT